jgi:pantoate--beta-alanine ligase
MDVICTPSEMRKKSADLKRSGSKIGFVPTMGDIHEGHNSLIRMASSHSDATVVSIFVNPTQFASGEDFERYPRKPDEDLAACQVLGVNVAFVPTHEAMYPEPFSLYVNEDRLSNALCGPFRPGHFRGVLTIVAKLFNIVSPDSAYFGQKDAQQATLIKHMISAMNYSIDLQIGPTIRGHDGLAISSRNRYLATEERQRAVCLYESLMLARELYEHGECDANVVATRMRRLIDEGAPPVDIDYIEILDAATLEPVKAVKTNTLIALAIRVGNTRLIDNLLIE